jgi:NAD(P)-dependent dehydrogenase (short-subunit alcohol dehydrogenase family)
MDSKTVLVVGGSGEVGSRTVRTLRRLQPELSLLIGVRDVERARPLAAEVGARVLPIDLGRDDLGLPVQRLAAVAVFLKDESLRTLRFAQDHGVPYIAFSDFSFEIAPVVALHIARPASAAILMLGQLLGGTVALSALHFARELKRVDRIAIGALLDASDMGGPAAQGDAIRVQQALPNAFIRQDGRFVFAQGAQQQRAFVSSDGERWNGQAYPLLDVASLAAASGAGSLRVDFAVRPSVKGKLQTEVVVELDGVREDGEPGHVRFSMRDADFHAGLSAYGAAFALERLLGLSGGARVAPGLYNPEQLLDPASVVARLRELGSVIERF